MPTERIISIKTPLGEGALLFRQMSTSEELGRLFEYTLELLSEDPEIKLEDVLGQPITVNLELPDGSLRYFNGLVTRFSLTGTYGKYITYHATLRPWFWFLTRKSDCRIFQEQTVPDIIKQVFRDNGFSDFEEVLSGNYREWNFCVQYRETDFNFVSRLMEQEGIYYYFKHEDGKHTLVLSDSASSHDAFPGFSDIPYKPTGATSHTTEDHIATWQLTKAVQTGTYSLRDFDFEKPRASLETKSTVTRDHQYSEFEFYDYPGEYVESSDGDNYVSTRIQELQAQHERVEATANARGVATGCLFNLTEFPRADQMREYLLVSVSYELSIGGYESGADGGDHISCHFIAMDSKQAFRPQRITPKPSIQGPQTAIVVGKAGEEIWTDKYGRVKVKFHWDRSEAADENSSCWVRVANLWAGKKWGGIHIPRMGQEVIIEFLEGDPDRPIITGRVYNADNMPPYDLPANATQSGIKSRSSKEGSPDNFNEIRFEDKKGEEQVYIHAEKNQDNIVENDETTEVGNDRKEHVGNDETITIDANRTESVGKNESISIGENRTEDVGKNESITIGENRTVDVGKNETISIGDSQTISVAKDQSEDIGKTLTLNIGEDRTTQVAKDDALDVGKKLTMIAGDQITLKTGQASIVMKKDGTITIKGKDITVQGSGSINIKASKNVVIKGSKVTQN